MWITSHMIGSTWINYPITTLNNNRKIKSRVRYTWLGHKSGSSRTMTLGSSFYLGIRSSFAFWMLIRIAMEFKTCFHDMVIPIAMRTLAYSFLRKLLNNKGSPHSRLTIKHSLLAVCLGTNNCINLLNIWKGSSSKDTIMNCIQMCI